MAYVYGHYRKDNNQIFYVGCSNSDTVESDKRSPKQKYIRAFSENGRNENWKIVVEEAGGYTVEILLDYVSFECAYQKESELINQYGTFEYGGILANFSNPHSVRTNLRFKVHECNYAKLMEKYAPIIEKENAAMNRERITQGGKFNYEFEELDH